MRIKNRRFTVPKTKTWILSPYIESAGHSDLMHGPIFSAVALEDGGQSRNMK